MTFKATEKPKFYQLRWKLSSMLIKMAEYIYPQNPDHYARLMNQILNQVAIDQLVYGRAIVKVMDPVDELEEI